MNSFWLIEDYIFANDFLRFFWQKNVKSHVFLKSEKKRKIRILEHWKRVVTVLFKVASTLIIISVESLCIYVCVYIGLCVYNMWFTGVANDADDADR